MTIKLNKAFLFYNRDYLISFVFIHSLFFTVPAVILLVSNGIALWNFLILLAFNIAIFFMLRHTYPNKIEIKNKSIRFVEYTNMMQRGNKVKAAITLHDIRNVSFKQSKLEKLFNVGRISLMASPDVEIISGDLKGEKYPLSNSYTFSGVNNFELIKEKLNYK